MEQPTDPLAPPPHEPDHATQSSEPVSWKWFSGFIDNAEDDLLNQPWLRNHLGFIAICLACLALIVYWPYYGKRQLAEIVQLERQLTDIRYRSLITRAALIEHERVENVLQQLSTHQLPLVPATQPPYLLIDSGQYPTPTPPARH